MRSIETEQLNRSYVSPNDDNIHGETDSQFIQNAVDHAAKCLIDKVIIPRYNRRTGTMKWVIDSTIYLPSGMTVVLDHCYLMLAAGAKCNVFANANIHTAIGKTLQGEQTDIAILGLGNVVIDGGEYNGLSQSNSLKNGNPHISKNTPILFSNVNRFKISGLRVINQRFWGMTFLFCRNGKISDIDFQADLSRIDENGIRYPDQLPLSYDEIYIKNADGVDLRVGCNNITIENITGITEDDTVALTALIGKNFESQLLVEGKDTDIHDVMIRNVRADCYVCATVRLLCADGNKVYNILIDGVFDESDYELARNRNTHATIRLNDRAYVNLRKAEPGDTRDIIINNVISRAYNAVSLSTAVRNVQINNIILCGPAKYAVANLHQGVYENISVRGIIHTNPSDDCAAVRLVDCTCENIHVSDVITPGLKNITQESK